MTVRKYDHYPIRDKRDFDPESFRTITLDPERNIKGVIGCRKGYWDAEKEKCRKGTELQKFLYPIGTRRFVRNPSAANLIPPVAYSALALYYALHNPSQKLLVENPSKKQMQQIADALQCPVAAVKEMDKEIEMYERFHKKKPDAVLKASHPEIPESLVALGRLESVIYRKNGQSYIHDLKHGILAADRKGKLYIIGDRAKITRRGIVG